MAVDLSISGIGLGVEANPNLRLCQLSSRPPVFRLCPPPGQQASVVPMICVGGRGWWARRQNAATGDLNMLDDDDCSHKLPSAACKTLLAHIDSS